MILHQEYGAVARSSQDETESERKVGFVVLVAGRQPVAQSANLALDESAMSSEGANCVDLAAALPSLH